MSCCASETTDSDDDYMSCCDFEEFCQEDHDTSGYMEWKYHEGTMTIDRVDEGSEGEGSEEEEGDAWLSNLILQTQADMWNTFCLRESGCVFPVGEGRVISLKRTLEVKRFESSFLKGLLTSSLELLWTLNR